MAGNVAKKTVSDTVMKRYKKLVQPKLNLVRDLKARGVPESDIAKELGIGYQTFIRWKKAIQELAMTLDTAKTMHLQLLVGKATEAACGYYFTETKNVYDEVGNLVKTEKHRKWVKPDALLLMFLIKHEDPETYGDITVEGNADVHISFVPAKKKNIKEKSDENN